MNVKLENSYADELKGQKCNERKRR